MPENHPTNPSTRPNIVFVMADDHAAWALGAEGAGWPRTPVLDGLARKGVHLRHVFANAAVCSPARAIMLTGRYASEVGIDSFLPDGAAGIAGSVPTWPEVLRRHGYRTAMVGKWHLGDRSEADLPTAKGYEFFDGYPVGGKRSRDPDVLVDGQWQRFEGQYTSDVLTDLAIRRIEQFQGEAFAVSLHFWAPHANQEVPEGYQLPHDDRTWLPLAEEDLAATDGLPDFQESRGAAALDRDRLWRMRREYFASIHSIDRNLGRLMQRLRDLGLVEDTIVVYTSDHGYLLGQHGLWHKGNGWWLTPERRDPAGVHNDLMDDRPMVVRHNLYDPAMQVPGIVHWPRGLPAGHRPEQAFTHVDWFPTLLAMAGIEPPANATLRGRNALPLLRGEDWPHDDAVFAQHEKLRAWRTPRWKLVRDFAQLGRDELYDLAEDPDEHINLMASDDPTVFDARRELSGALCQHMQRIDDPLLSYAQAFPLN